jgi:hypothetical protein
MYTYNGNVKMLKKSELYSRLMNLKALYLHAESHSYSNGTVDRMLSILGFDLAVEYLLNIIIEYLNVDNTELHYKLAAKIQGIKKYLTKEDIENRFFDAHFLNNLHSLRNLTQHGQIFPPEDIDRQREAMEDFINGCLCNIFGIRDVTELRLYAAFEDGNIRGKFSKAEIKMDKRDFPGVVAHLRDAFDWGFHRTLSYRFVGHDRIIIGLELEKEDPTTGYFLGETVNKVDMLSLGINLLNYFKYEDIIRKIPMEYIKDKNSYYGVVGEITEYEAKYCFDFVYENLLKWEQQTTELMNERRKLRDRLTDETDIYRTYLGRVRIPGTEFPSVFEGCYFYPGSKPTRTYEYIYVGERSKELLMSNLKVNNIYYRTVKKKVGKKFITHSRKEVKLILLNSRVVVNAPLVYILVYGLEDLG